MYFFRTYNNNNNHNILKVVWYDNLPTYHFIITNPRFILIYIDRDLYIAVPEESARAVNRMIIPNLTKGSLPERDYFIERILILFYYDRSIDFRIYSPAQQVFYGPGIFEHIIIYYYYDHHEKYFIILLLLLK